MKKILILLTVALVLSSCNSPEQGTNTISLKDGWKIHKGDDLSWAETAYDDSDWQKINPGTVWEYQLEEYKNYDGYAWYRIHFILPKSIREKSYFGKELQISLGAIDDTEQTFLNGSLLGQNNILNSDPNASAGDFSSKPDAYSYFRNYIIPVDDSRLKWGESNVIAIRVNDTGGNGGMYYPSPSISMLDIKDYLKINVLDDPFEMKGDHYSKSIRLVNIHESESFSGVLTVKVTSNSNDKEIYKSRDKVVATANAETEFMFTFAASQTESYNIEYIYEIDNSNYPVIQEQGTPYILTPPPSEEPVINGPEVFGVRPGHPLLYTIPVSGARPVTYAAEDLPEGVTLDSIKGFLRGSIKTPGDYPVILIASNSLGENRKNFIIKVGDQIQLTPPMGWNSWNCWGLSVSDEKVRSSANAMVESGLINYGWTFMNIDDGWEADERTSRGALLPNSKFPDMKSLTAYIHNQGLKLGIYSSPGPLTCGGYLGTYMHDKIDAKTWADWGIDYLKFDWCSYGRIAKNHTDPQELKKPYFVMRSALDKVNRDIVYSLCQYGMGDVSSWGNEVGGNLWRTTGDITDTWESLKEIGFSQYKHSAYASPGSYNDPDMMILGWVGWGPNLHPTRLTADEQYTHVSLWCLLSAPLLLGNDLSRLDDFTISLLTNSEVLSVNQDALCNQANLVCSQDSIQVWMKDMADGSKVVGFFNMDDMKKSVTIPLSKMELSGTFSVRNLWKQEDIGEVSDEINVTVYSHGVVLVKMTKNQSPIS